MTRRPLARATFLAAGLIAAAGCLFAAPASAQLWASQTPVTSMVDVDGHRVRIRTAAPQPHRPPGQPLVVLEAGFGSTVNSWGPFIGEVAAVAPVLAYDRAGLGESEWDGQTPTFAHITGRLRRLLAEVGAEPPFVLVGHSFGGDLICFFADHYPAETVGLVLLDPVVSSPGDFMRALEEIGAGEAEYLEVHGAAAEGPPGLRAEDEMTKEYFLNMVEPDLPRPTHLPVSIIVSGLDVPPDAQEQYSFDVARHVQALERLKVARLGGWILQVPEGQTSPAGPSVLTPVADTVHVAPPTGAAATDRANILAALEGLEPGGTLLFASGTYWIGGAFIQVPVPDVILQGHPDSTILRGCEPADLVEHERMTECNGLELTGPRQTIRGFTFEHIGSALWVGCCLEPAAPDHDGGQLHGGGHLIEGNTFRGTWNGIRVIGDSPEPAVIRDNEFVNTWHAVTVNGRTAHILGNRVSVPAPEQVPVNGHVGIAIAVIAHDTRLERAFTCAGNVIAGNRIEGHPEAIGILAFQSGASCRENVIRDNTIAAARVRFSGPSWGVMGIREQVDSTLAGVPIALADLSAQMAGSLGLPAGDHDEDLIHENRIEGNRVTGAEGLAIQLVGASRNRVVGNTITGVRRREPFPGNTMIDDPEPWRAANGSGIWVSPGSDGNVVAGNAFEDVAAYEVFIEGDRNRVELRSPSDAVRDLGSGNRVAGPGTSTEEVQRDEPLYESKFVETRGIRLQYMDFGGSGLPVIFVQDFHDYFSLEEESQHAAWLSRFADDFRVLAPVRRGYGESDDTGWGYDVATQSADLLGLMDALGIRRAVLVGRNAATQDMTWIAEHHPERLAGLVYLENPLVAPDYRDPLARTFAEMYWRGTCDMGAGDDAIARTGPRAPWRPHLLYDDAPRIDIPALRFFAPQIESRSVDLRRLDRLAIIAASDHCGDEPAREYFVALAADEERVAAIRRELTEGDLSLAVHHAMGRAFGTNLRTVTMEGDFAGREAIREFRDPHIRSFLEEVALREGARPPGPARDPNRRE